MFWSKNIVFVIIRILQVITRRALEAVGGTTGHHCTPRFTAALKIKVCSDTERKSYLIHLKLN